LIELGPGDAPEREVIVDLSHADLDFLKKGSDALLIGFFGEFQMRINHGARE